MDRLINRYDVYKVETISSVYMCVSGIPIRNGQRHVTEIARMSLDIINAAKRFHIASTSLPCPTSASAFASEHTPVCYSNTTVYYGIHERSECISVDSGVTNLIHDRRNCVDFMLEVEANVARCVHSSVNKPGVKRNSGL